MNFKKAARSIVGISSLAFGIYAASANMAQAGTLDFSGTGVSNGSPIPQSYGDEANLDITYQSLSGAGNSAPASQNLYYWSSGYSGLQDVAYGNLGSVAEVFLKPLNGVSVTLKSFSLGGYLNANRTSQYSIYNADYSELLASSGGPFTVLGSTPTQLLFNLTRDDGIRIQFGPDAYNVGIDNIEYTVNNPTAIPTPALLPGLIGLGAAALRKRKQEKVEAEV